MFWMNHSIWKWLSHFLFQFSYYPFSLSERKRFVCSYSWSVQDDFKAIGFLDHAKKCSFRAIVEKIEKREKKRYIIIFLFLQHALNKFLNDITFTIIFTIMLYFLVAMCQWMAHFILHEQMKGMWNRKSPQANLWRAIMTVKTTRLIVYPCALKFTFFPLYNKCSVVRVTMPREELVTGRGRNS